MKPVSVRFKCFGPYMDEQFIDFQKLEKNGLFLICGETGSGKTTILDAICYALYGRSSGGLRGDMETMRCKLAEKQDETLAEFIFDSDGKRYRFTRAMKYKTKNLNKYHKCALWDGEEFVPLAEKQEEVNQKARELVGLTYDQFRQVIILPQGQFEKFLTSESREKEAILVTMFNVQQWGRIAGEINERVNRRAEVLAREQADITARLRHYGCESLESLGEKKEQLTESLEGLSREAESATGEVRAKTAVLAEARLDDRAFRELESRRVKCRELEKRQAFFAAEEPLLKQAEEAEKLRDKYLEYRNARQAKCRAEELLEKKERERAAAVSAMEKADAAWERHQLRAPEMEQEKTKLLRMEDAAEVYRNLSRLRREVRAAELAETEAAGRLDSANRDFEARDRELKAALEEQAAAMEEYSRAQKLYRRGIGSILAETLAEGEKCPVCGSTVHPEPAEKTAEHVSEARLDKLNKAMNQTGKAVSSAIKARSLAENEKNEKQQALGDARRKLDLARAERDAGELQKIPGIETAAALEEAVRKVSAGLRDYETEGQRLTEIKNKAESGLLALEKALHTAAEELTAAQGVCVALTGQWRSALEDSGFRDEQRYLAACLAPEEKNRRRDALTAYRTNLELARSALAEQAEALEGKTAPDIGELERSLAAAQQQEREINRRQILEKKLLEEIEADGKKLTRRLEKYEEEKVRVDADKVFAQRLVGSHGVGLQRYVLGVMMNSITVQANRLLERVYGGRYRLYRTDETSGRVQKGGLELEVFDSHNNQRRSVRTLSGGEKFLVALSLAIGLSAVVQAQGDGIRLEAMFIDEGFGSLDRESVGDALEILQGIQRSAGVVGIISHVEALAETIPTRIEITKGQKGSSCRIVDP